ncbi:zinc finger protein 596-like [Sitophilus oryzae]|uniref:Zinc finger protein 596-like n=1 Tax=Sitophilus oryzae TaxID=7048 RepID=A0A6J2XMI9_SITOR|nr:zinc finger protein 596-like [Sitophilus oryzae]
MHLRLHENRAYQCRICDKNFRSSTLATDHEKFHRNQTSKQCEICGKAFFTAASLNQHQREIHFNDVDRHDCKLCGKHYGSAGGLKWHNLHHHNDSREDLYVSCDICGKRIHRDRIRSHEKLHKGVKPYICEICDRKYTDKKRLREHMNLTHKKTGEQGFVCRECGSSFDNWTSLKDHEMEHTSKLDFM